MSLTRLVLAGSAVALLTPSLYAATYTWGNTATDFNANASWSGNAAPTTTGTAIFTGASVFNPTVTAPISLAQLNFDATASGYTVSGTTITLGSTGNNTVISGSNAAGNITVSANLALTTGSKTFGIAGGSYLTVSGDISETGAAAAIVLSRVGAASGTSTFTLSGNNTFSGGVVLGAAGGVLNIGSANALGTGTFSITTTSGAYVNNVAGTPLTFANNLLFKGNAMNSTGGDMTFTGAATLAYSQVNIGAMNVGQTITFTGAIGEDVAGRVLRKDGPGIVVFSGMNNTYSGGTVISGGTLAVSKIGNTSSTSSSLGAGTSVLKLGAGGSGNNATITYTGTGETSDRAIDFNCTGGSVGIENNGTGALVLSNITNTVIGNKILILGGSNTDDNTIAAPMVDTTGRTTSVTKNGSGTWVLSGTNTATGVMTVNQGTLKFAKKVSLYNGTTANWTSTKIKVAAGATLAVNVGGTDEFSASDVTTLLGIGGSATAGFITGSLIGFDTTNAAGGNFDYGSVIGNAYAGSTRGVAKLGSNTLTLSGVNTYTGDTKVSAGRLNVNGSLAAGSAVSVASGATLGGSGTVNGNVSVAGGTIDGTGVSLQGTTTFTGASNWSGSATAAGLVTVSSGTTNVTGNVTASAGVTAASGAKLSVNGAITGAVTVDGALGGSGSISSTTDVRGILAPGNSIGTLSTGDLMLGAASLFDVELGVDGGVAVSDRVNVTGLVDIVDGAQLSLTLSTGTIQSGDLFFLIDNDGSDVITGALTLTSALGGTSLIEGTEFSWNSQTWKITYQADAGSSSFTNGNDVALQVVPEPATWALLTGGMGMLVAMQGLRRRSKAS